jgi:hypothetical protein
VLTGKLRNVAGILADTDSMHAKMLGEMERERETNTVVHHIGERVA